MEGVKYVSVQDIAVVVSPMGTSDVVIMLENNLAIRIDAEAAKAHADRIRQKADLAIAMAAKIKP